MNIIHVVDIMKASRLGEGIEKKVIQSCGVNVDLTPRKDRHHDDKTTLNDDDIASPRYYSDHSKTILNNPTISLCCRVFSICDLPTFNYNFSYRLCI